MDTVDNQDMSGAAQEARVKGGGPGTGGHLHAVHQGGVRYVSVTDVPAEK